MGRICYNLFTGLWEARTSLKDHLDSTLLLVAVKQTSNSPKNGSIASNSNKNSLNHVKMALKLSQQKDVWNFV